jgi:hypothetical protein
MENGPEIRRRILVDGPSPRSVRREFGIPGDTLQKILAHPEPPGYRRATPRAQSQLDPCLPVSHPILEADQKAPRKPRHTTLRIFPRLRDASGSSGGLTAVKAAVATSQRRSAQVFVPLAHRPGEAQVDFGAAELHRDGRPKFLKVPRLLEWSGLKEGTRAVGQALEWGSADADAVRLIRERRRERPVGLFGLDGRPHGKRVEVPTPDLSRSGSLRAGVTP